MALDPKDALREVAASDSACGKHCFIFKCSDCPAEIEIPDWCLDKAQGRCWNCSQRQRGLLRGKNKKPFETLWSTRRDSAKRRGLEFTLTYEELLTFTSIKVCHYCDGSVEWLPQTTSRNGLKQQPNLNLDRRDNALGYAAENLVVCCGMCNHIKGCRLTYEDMIVLKPCLQLLQRKLASENRRWHGHRWKGSSCVA